MTDTVLILSRRTLLIAAAALIGVVAIALFAFVPGPADALGRLVAPQATADPAALAAQRTATEHGIQRGYAKATDQLRQVRELTLAISASEAAAIDGKARDDLRAIRHEALAALGRLTGRGGSALDPYLAATEGQLDQAEVSSEPGTLLAPPLFDIVRRADELFAQTADTATRQLTRAPSAPPTARPSASPATPSPAGTGAASPSPTGR